MKVTLNQSAVAARAAANRRDSLPAEGVYEAELTDAEITHAKSSGHQMLVMKFKDTEDHRFLVRDNAMLEGKGEGIGYQKLKAFGITGDELDTDDLLGKRVFVAIKHGEFNGDAKAEVDISAKGSNAGYWTENPETGGKASEPAKVEDTPF